MTIKTELRTLEELIGGACCFIDELQDKFPSIKDKLGFVYDSLSHANDELQEINKHEGQNGK